MISLKIYFYYSCWPLKLKKKTEVLSFDLNNKCCYIIKASTAQNILPRFYRDNILARLADYLSWIQSPMELEDLWVILMINRTMVP